MPQNSARLVWLKVVCCLGIMGSSITIAEAYADEGQVYTRSLYGSYLAGRFARSSQDTKAAAEFYERALLHDPKSPVLLEQAFQMETMSGNWARAVKLAERLSKAKKSHRMSQFLLGVAAFKAGGYQQAEKHFKAAAENPIGELTSAVATAWTRLAAGDKSGAIAAVDLPSQPDWAKFYLRYHRALIADIAGNHRLARQSYEAMYRQDSRTLRTTLAYAQHTLSRGEFRLAHQVISGQLSKANGEPHPLIRDLQRKIALGNRTDLMINTPTQGLAEVFYGLGEALTGEGGVSLGTIYLQLALRAMPDHVFALAALAGAQENAKRYQDAIQTYSRIEPGTPLDDAIAIRKALNLNSLDRLDEARQLLEDLAKRNPRDLRPLEALGNIMRARKRYAEAVTYFSRAIDIIDRPREMHWPYYYARGTAYERLKNWPAAEKDLLKANRLSPDQPLVLNYLGYSWIDQGKNLRQGTRMIEKAVRLKPDDGYIVDSLGWALFKQGKYKLAVRYLERAVELKPQDPTLNDHLGDAYWHVGREREARFQWDQALSLNPEPEEVVKIRAKLENGLIIKSQAKAEINQRLSRSRPNVPRSTEQ